MLTLLRVANLCKALTNIYWSPNMNLLKTNISETIQPGVFIGGLLALLKEVG